MDIFQITTSGQITIPKKIRQQLKTKHFTCEHGADGVLILRPVSSSISPSTLDEGSKVKKYSIMDLRKAIIKNSKCPNETNLAEKIDTIVYGI